MMQSLISTYAQAEYDAGDDGAVVDVLNTESVEVRDDALYTWAGIALLAGAEAAEMLRLALEQSSMGWAVHQFGGTGLQMTNPLVRSAVEQFILAGIPLEPILDATISFVSPSVQSLGREVVLADVAAYRLSVLKQTLEGAATDRLQAYREALSSWDGSGEGPVL